MANQPNWTKRSLIALVLAGLFAGGAWYWKSSDRNATTYQTATVTKGSLTQVVTATPYYQTFLRRFPTLKALAAARHETMPEMPVTGLPGGSFADYLAARAQLDAALAMRDDITMVSPLAAARAPYARYLGWLRDELGRLLHPPTA